LKEDIGAFRVDFRHFQRAELKTEYRLNTEANRDEAAVVVAQSGPDVVRIS